MDGDHLSWDLWRAFTAVAESGTLSGAARRLGVTQPTVGRQIEALERALGFPLFVRSPQGLTATGAALALAPLADAMAAAAGALARASVGAGAASGGVVRLTASEVIAGEVLPDIIASFRAAHPDIDIELSVSNQIEDLLTRKADLAVRMTRPTQQKLLAKKLGVIPVYLYARRDYLARTGAPASLETLSGHTIIGYDSDRGIIAFLNRKGVPASKETFALRTDNELAQHALLRAGAGIGGMQAPLARRTPDLVPVLHDQFTIPMELWLVMHEDLRRARPVRAMFEHLEQGLTAYLAEGAAGKPVRRARG